MKTVNLHQLALLLTEARNDRIAVDPIMDLEQALHDVLSHITFIDIGGDTAPVKVAVSTPQEPASVALRAQVGGDHYKGDKIQHVEFVHANGVPYEEACAMKYLMRHRKKNGVQDVDKAIHYCFLLRQLEYPDATPIIKVW